MMLGVQNASMWKRISALLLDVILLVVAATGFASLVSSAVSFDEKSDALTAIEQRYEREYATSFDLTDEALSALTPEQQQAYLDAAEALAADAQAQSLYQEVLHLMLLITSLGIFFAYLLLEFAVPLLLKDGQTVGKKVFGLCLVRPDCIRVSPMQLFVRAVLGKYAVETMIPVLLVVLIFFGLLGSTGTLVLAALLLGQSILVGMSRHNTALHDLLAHTVCADRESQLIFAGADALDEYIQSHTPNNPTGAER